MWATECNTYPDLYRDAHLPMVNIPPIWLKMDEESGTEENVLCHSNMANEKTHSRRQLASGTF